MYDRDPFGLRPPADILAARISSSITSQVMNALRSVISLRGSTRWAMQSGRHRAKRPNTQDNWTFVRRLGARGALNLAICSRQLLRREGEDG
jgi:hypothetical protein